jgi:hypothetical protein
MKGITSPTIYFSAYSLKNAEQKADNSNEPSKKSSPYLRALLAGRSRTSSKVRVFPMINPYREQDARPVNQRPAIIRQLNQVPGDIELTEKKWFHNYE